ncbi:MAG: KDO2-lipid IV(A) lauroyltransferase [Oceanicoccus sp.]|jgi:KDO2-lipid IV(A) lauroyltransferase
MSQAQAAQWTDFLAPRFWGTWLLLAFMRLLGALPMAVGLAAGNGLGSLLYRLALKRRRVTEVNIGLCFPERDSAAQKTLVKDVFKANSIGLVETAWAYWRNPAEFSDKVTFKNIELLDQALEQGKGVLLLGGHFSTLDLGGFLLALYGLPVNAIYRQHNNPLMDYMICRCRARFTNNIERKKFREVLRTFRKNQFVWYAPDQDFGSKGAVFVPFFGQPAATIVATTKLAKLNQSPLLMFSHHRNPDNRSYTLEIIPVPDFPSGDETEDAAIINRVIEQAVRKAPEQYMWVHKRFKTQPDGKQKLYKAAGC